MKIFASFIKEADGRTNSKVSSFKSKVSSNIAMNFRLFPKGLLRRNNRLEIRCMQKNTV